jgi:hypothetical protein
MLAAIAIALIKRGGNFLDLSKLETLGAGLHSHLTNHGRDLFLSARRAPMNRRQIIALLGLPLPLAGCGGETASVRYRVIATAEVDGERVEGSTVMEVAYTRVTTSLIGAGGATTLYGEALILDLKGKGTVFVIPYTMQKSGSLSQIYEAGILSTLGITNSIGGLLDKDFERLRTVKGRMPFRLGNPQWFPIFVAFRDEKVPRSIYEVDPKNMAGSFPGVRFISLDIEITDAPVTEVLKQRLPWLDHKTGETVFARDPPGKQRALRDRPLGYKILENKFFGNGSR